MCLLKRKRSLLIIILLFIFLFTSCSAQRAAVNRMPISDTRIKAAATGAEAHTLAYKKLSPIAASGYSQLYVDDTTGGVSVLNTYSGYYWNSLPVYQTNTACVLSVTAIGATGIYELNSQDNSVSFHSFTVDSDKNGVTVVYRMSNKAETAQKDQTQLLTGELLVIIPVRYSLTDGDLTVLVDCGEIFVSKGYILSQISLLPYFGGLCYSEQAMKENNAFYTLKNTLDKQKNEVEQSNKNEAESELKAIEPTVEESTQRAFIEATEDYLLVPDGCGAVMYTKIEDSVNRELRFKVYGDNEDENAFLTCLGAFGIKNKQNALVGTVLKGEALCTVHAVRDAADENGVNRVYPEFLITPCKTQNGRLYYGKAYTDEILVCYRFLCDQQADAVNMAAVCRELLIREGYLPALITKDEPPLINIGVIGSVNGSSDLTVTDFAQVQDLSGVVKAKGIDHFNLILQGFFSKGLLQNESSGFLPLKSCGGKTQLHSLCDYVSKQNLGLYLGVNLLSTKTASHTVKTITGQRQTAEYKNPLVRSDGKSGTALSVLKADKIEKNVIRLMNATKDYSITGVCINDVFGHLYEDFSKNGASVTKTKRIVSQNTASFSVQKKLMMNGCSFYALDGCDYLLDVPFYTNVPETAAYQAIPFLPAILHAGVLYSGPAVNTKMVTRLELLKCVEYGGIPFVLWTADENTQLYYGHTVSDVTDFAKKADKELGDLAGYRFCAHQKIEDGVYFTQYENGAGVYVNYNNYSVNINNISVSPYDFVRIN